jgi:flavin reductase (DIM6/NTAB) family NADH-FMN oxidoreductase RutF
MTRPRLVSVPLVKAYRLTNHGPTVLVTSAHGEQRNIMAAAWNMPLDFDPPKIALVIDKNTYTRELIEASGRFAINVPCRAQAEMTVKVGSHSGRELRGKIPVDKFALHGINTFAAEKIAAPLVEGCAAWLECSLIPEPHIQTTYDLFLAEVVTAWADERVFSNGRWHFNGHDDLRTIHHVAGGAFFATGEAFQTGTLK